MTDFRSRRQTWLIALAIAVLTFLAYANSFNGPFVFDDEASIETNATIRDLGALKQLVNPPTNGVTVTGRPLLNVSLALNYATGGTKVQGYHQTNLVIHIVAALLLFGVMRQTLTSARLGEKFGESAVMLSGAIALLWSLHPVQTESVTYVIQRAESLAGAFYLLIFYAFARGTETASRSWFLVAVLAAYLGVSTKETVATAPFVLLCYDRIFFAGSWREIWRQRKGVHLALASSWLLQALWLGMAGLNRGGTMGTPPGGVIGFALTQFEAIAHYVRLALWPKPLILDYGFPWIPSVTNVAPEIVMVVSLAGGTIWALIKKPPLGFAGLWFFAILAPTSLVPGTLQVIVEHRLYLPLAAVIAVVSVMSFAWVGREVLGLLLVIALGLGAMTFNRNRDYQDDAHLWADTLTHRPDNARAHNNLGGILALNGKLDEAIGHFRNAVKLKPDYARAHSNLGGTLMITEKTEEGLAEFHKAIELAPWDSAIHNSFGNALVNEGRFEDADRQYQLSQRGHPEYRSQQETTFGLALLERGKIAEAVQLFEKAVERRPGAAEPHLNLGRALARAGQSEKSLQHFRESVRLAPYDANGFYYYGNSLLAVRRLEEAAAAYQHSIELNPRVAEPHNNLGTIYFRQGKNAEARAEFAKALKINPGSQAAKENIAKLGRAEDFKKQSSSNSSAMPAPPVLLQK